MNFIKTWDFILSEDKFRQTDWTVKADSDCVFFPDRLQLHLKRAFPRGTDGNFYIKNCPKSMGFIGALEVISTTGIESYGRHSEFCRTNMRPDRAGEDGYMQACFEYSGMVAKEDFGLLVDNF